MKISKQYISIFTLCLLVFACNSKTEQEIKVEEDVNDLKTKIENMQGKINQEKSYLKEQDSILGKIGQDIEETKKALNDLDAK